MRKHFLSIVIVMAVAINSYGQFLFDVEIDPKEFDYAPEQIVVPNSPLKTQALFIGGVDHVQTTATYGNEPGQALAKEWHDFIGFTEDTDEESDDLGWVSVNHEMTIPNDSIGDGGGMTVFKVKRNPRTELLYVVEQTLEDGRQGEFFNVDFVNTVGETGMNCGGFVTPDGRVFSAEEWFRDDNGDVEFLRNLAPFTIGTGDGTTTLDPEITPLFNGSQIEAYQNFNWMVEIDPRKAVAKQKMYNWGRLGWEGGASNSDMTAIYLTEDYTPGLLIKFVPDEPEGDFQSGSLFAFKHDADDEEIGNWIEIDNSVLNNMLNIREEAFTNGATMFNRLEWSTWIDGKLYMTETGRDGVGSRFFDWAEMGGVLSPHYLEVVRGRLSGFEEKPDQEVIDYVVNGNFSDYYGRILVYDPETDEVEVFLEGGPFYEESPDMASYPDRHLSNPDGLNQITIDGQAYMVICEDLNGTSNGRVPAGVSNRTCELFLLNMSDDPTLENLVRIAAVPRGAEVTGALGTPDGKSILLNSQHPSGDNPFPDNHSVTYEIGGWDLAVSAINDVKRLEEEALNSEGFQVYPNPVERTVFFNKTVDLAIYNNQGARVKVFRNVNEIEVDDLDAGIYLIKNNFGEVRKLVIE